MGQAMGHPSVQLAAHLRPVGHPERGMVAVKIVRVIHTVESTQANDMANISKGRQLLLASARQPDSVEQRELALTPQNRHVSGKGNRSKSQAERSRNNE